MRIARIILSVIALLGCLGAAGAASYLYFVAERRLGIRVPVLDQVVAIDIIAAVVAGVLLALALALFPWGAKKKTKADAGPKTSAADARKALQAQANKKASIAFKKEAADAAEADSDVSTYARLDDPEAMARLVVIDQGEMSHEVVKNLLKEYYPELVGIMDKIKEDDHRTLDTLGRHIIGIARNMLKMTDKELSDNQFAIFQERNFKAEQEEFLRMYQPGDVSILSDEQRSYLGIIVDERAWESVQRTVRGQRTDWASISLSNAKQYL